MVAYYGGGEGQALIDPIGDIPLQIDPSTIEHIDVTAAAYAELQEQRAIEAVNLAELAQYEANQQSLRDYNALIAAQEGDLWRNLAESYVGWYETKTPSERITDVVFEVGSGIGAEVADITGTNIITGGITAAGGAFAEVLDPITAPLGKGLQSAIIPAAVIVGALVLLK